MKALRWEILRNTKASGRISIPLEEKPVRVATLISEADLISSGGEMVHNQNVFLEDRIHDWDWRDGLFRYYSRVAEMADVLVVYELMENKNA